VPASMCLSMAVGTEQSALIQLGLNAFPRLLRADVEVLLAPV
jgi:hypothetical protein